MTEIEIYRLFRKNWVFLLFSSQKVHYIVVALLVSLVPLLIGVVQSLILGVFKDFRQSFSPIFHSIGFFIALIAYGWFTRRFTKMTCYLFPAFEIEADEYICIVRKWADRIANNLFWFLLLALVFVILTFGETKAIWQDNNNVPDDLSAWVNSGRRFYFYAFYFFEHVILTSFLLSSGIIGLIGVMFVINDILNLNLKLSHYRRTKSLISFFTTLFFWSIVALSVVSLGRWKLMFPGFVVGSGSSVPQIELKPSVIATITQSLLVIAIALMIGSFPYIKIRNTIMTSKAKYMNAIEEWYATCYQNNRIFGKLSEPGERDSVADGENEQDSLLLERLQKLSAHIESIPSLPVSWPNILGIISGVLIAVTSSLAETLINIVAGK